MKTTNLQHKKWLLYCILLCIPFYFWNAPQAAFGAESQNTLTVSDLVEQNLGSLELPQVQGPLYLEYSLPKTRFYLGERVPITVTLYVGNIVVNNVDPPVLGQPEFMLDSIGNPSQQKLRINGRSYQVIKFPCLLSPLQTGSFKLGPLSTTLYVPTTTGKKRTMDVTANPIQVRVLDVPIQGRPEHFSGGVGNFGLSVSANPHQVKLGEPVTIRMVLTGSGNLSVVSTPFLKEITGLRAYSALKKSDLSNANQVTFEQIAIPVDKRVKQIGPFSFAYFDPYAGKYKRLVAPALPISVKDNPGFKNDLQDPTSQVSIQSKMVTIKKELGTLYSAGWQLVKEPWFWFLQLLPLLLLIGAVVYRRHIEFMQSDSPQARAIRSSNFAKEQMAAVQALSDEGRYHQLPDQLHRILREFLAERFELAAAGMTGSVVQKLSGQGIQSDLLQDIQYFFEQYDSHRFSHMEFSQEETTLLFEKIKHIIASFEEIH
jgi:hypothetical protein